MTKIIIAVLLTSSAFAQLPGAAKPVAAAQVAPDATNLYTSNKDEQTIDIPPGARNIEFSVTVDAPNLVNRAMPGYGAGIWVQFQNAAGERMNLSGKVITSTAHGVGFGVGIGRKTSKPKTVTQKVAVPPGAGKVFVTTTLFVKDSRNVYTADTFKATDITVKVVP